MFPTEGVFLAFHIRLESSIKIALMKTTNKTICPTLSKEFGKSRTNGLVTLIFSSHIREEEQTFNNSAAFTLHIHLFLTLIELFLVIATIIYAVCCKKICYLRIGYRIIYITSHIPDFTPYSMELGICQCF